MRLSLVALLVAALWPAPAMASGSAPAGDVPRLEAADDRLADALQRSPGGLELLRLVEAHAPAGSGSDQRAPGPQPLDPDGGAGPLPRYLPVLTSGAATEGSVPRRCEVLPYHATAPPFRG